MSSHNTPFVARLKCVPLCSIYMNRFRTGPKMQHRKRWKRAHYNSSYNVLYQILHFFNNHLKTTVTSGCNREVLPILANQDIQLFFLPRVIILAVHFKNDYAILRAVCVIQCFSRAALFSVVWMLFRQWLCSCNMQTLVTYNTLSKSGEP